MVLVILLASLCAGCSLPDRIVAKAATGYLRDGAVVFQREADPLLAEEGIPANFKLLEILIYKNPNDRALLTLAAEYIATYAYAFVEPKSEMLAISDPDAAEAARSRASDLYLRGRGYGLRALQRRKSLVQSLHGSPEELDDGLQSLRKSDLPALFWTAFCWGTYVNLNLDKPDALADSGAVQALMTRAIELDETYYYGGAHLFFGAVFATLPESAGGSAAKSREHFEKALEISEGRLLMTKVFFARYYAVRIQDAALFSATLKEVLETDPATYPNERLANTLARDRARFYLDHRSEYFLNP